MAVVQYSAIVTQLRGKLGGSVFNKSKNAFTLQKKQQQPKGARGFQSEVRNFFARFQRTWKTITSSQRTQWGVAAANNPTRDRFGNQTVLSGYNQFVKANMLAEYAGVTAPATPYTSPAPPFDVTQIGLNQNSFSLNSLGQPQITSTYSLQWAEDSPDYAFIIDISLPVSAGVTAYHGRYTHVVGHTCASEPTGSITVGLGVRYPLPQAGQIIYQRGRVIHVASGAVVFQEINRLYFTLT